MSHSNISIFVPHLGCPYQCSFCNQKHITGSHTIPRANDVHNAVKIAISSRSYNNLDCEIAFFGGSFTAIERDYMVELLSTAFEYVKSGTITGIRISTRPDCIDDEILKLLRKYGVTSIELGAQSMRERILKANERGHSAEDVVRASKLIKGYGFSLGLQMMTGLYLSDNEDDIYTANMLISLQPDTVRIYPTITIKSTYLEKLYYEGKYIPQTLDSATEHAVLLEDMFLNANIKVIRIGLHSIEPDSYVAGPWHPAFRELCEAFRFQKQISSKINSAGSYNIYVNPSDVSKVTGQNRSNIRYFAERGINLKVIQENKIKKSHLTIEEVK